MNERHDVPVGVPGPSQSANTDRLLGEVDDDLARLNDLGIDDQAPVFDKMHSALADALARTADAGVPPVPGRPGA